MTRWTCYARPVATGKTCYHVNETGRDHFMGVCCEKCGALRRAGEIRKAKGDIDKRPRRA